MIRAVFAVALLALLGGCGGESAGIKVGAKNFGESRVLAQMAAALAREQGLPVAGVVDYPDTRTVLEALKRGDIDVYPDYNGTGLLMLGQNPIADGDAAMERVRELYEPLGLSWRPRLGFANNYALVMRPQRAAELGIQTMSALVNEAPALRFGIEEDFESRPLDGLVPMNQRYGFEFADTVVVSQDQRASLYDRLLDGELDVVEGYTTDGQIADYGLVVLEDDLGFFPVYEASFLARAASLSEHQNLGAVLDSLAGRIDAASMQDLNRKVDIEGRSPQAVARDFLARQDLIAAGAVTTDDPLLVAASPLLAAGNAASDALRAARRAYQGREVQIDSHYAPLEEVADGTARLALVSADAFFDISTPAPTRDERFEAVATVGQNLLHLVTTSDRAVDLQSLESIATGPEGSSSHRVATLLVEGLGLGAGLQPMEAADTAALLAPVIAGEADAALVFAPEGDSALLAAFDADNLRLLAVEGWSEGANLVRFPFLRQARIPARVYPGQFLAVDTLGAQLVLAGPAPQAEDAVGDLGPSSIAVGLSPISAAAVEAMSTAISGTPLVDPTLRHAAALGPDLPEPPAAMNPAPDISLLSLAVVCLFIWLIWLLARPEYR